MNDAYLDKYCAQAVQSGITETKQIEPSTVETAAWVRLKCQFGCPGYDRSYCCPPNTPKHDETRVILDSYNRAILFHIEAIHTEDRGKRIREHYNMLTDMEGDLFKEGYYKALLFLSGPCRLCKECSYLNDDPCILRDRARPSMEACGIDVYETARNNGFPIETLNDRNQTQNHYCLMLID
ncbi:DUF2284 domain-containing protein [Chloroflexota bacterium]